MGLKFNLENAAFKVSVSEAKEGHPNAPYAEEKINPLLLVSAACREPCPGSSAWHHSRCHAASQAKLLGVHLGVLLFPEAWKNDTEAAWLLRVGSGFWPGCALQLCGS